MQRFFGHRPSGLRLYLFTALAAAFLLVPAAQAFAEGDGHIVFEGEGSGWVKGIEPGEPGEGGEPNIECHWTGTEIDVGTSPAEGSGVPGLHTCDTNLHVGFVGKALNVKRELGPITVWGGWEVQPGEGTPIVCSPEFTTCSAIGSPITIKATFNPEPVPPSNVTPPTVTGPAKEGKTEHGNAGTWSGGPESYTYQWWRCDAAGENCVEISGAESTEYTATSEDVGSTLRFEETATNGLGSASAESAATPVVVGAAAGSSEDYKEGEVYGEVPQTTSLASACSEVYLGQFLPGVAANYNESCVVTATSTGEETSLTAADETGVDVGYLTQKPTHPYTLAQLLEVQATDTESLGESSSTGFGTMATPYTVLTYGKPVSADNVEVEFNQPIALHDPLHTGVYSKTITLTLKQTTP